MPSRPENAVRSLPLPHARRPGRETAVGELRTLLLVAAVVVIAAVAALALRFMSRKGELEGGERPAPDATLSARSTAAAAPSPVGKVIADAPPAPNPPPQALTGVVQYTTGQPIAGAMVLLYSRSRPVNSTPGMQTSDAGIFTIANPPADPFTLEVISNNRSWLVPTHPATAERLVVEFPSPDEQAALDKERAARFAELNPVGIPVPMAEAAFYVNPANLGPMREAGCWPVRGIKVAGIKFFVETAGLYQFVVNARSAQAEGQCTLDVHIRNGPHFARFFIERPEWQDYAKTLEVPQGELFLQFQLAEGWGVDLQSVSLTPTQ